MRIFEVQMEKNKGGDMADNRVRGTAYDTALRKSPRALKAALSRPQEQKVPRG